MASSRIRGFIALPFGTVVALTRLSRQLGFQAYSPHCASTVGNNMSKP